MVDVAEQLPEPRSVSGSEVGGGSVGSGLARVSRSEASDVSSPDRFLLHFRLRHELSHQRMARLIGISPAQLAAIEQGIEAATPAMRKRVVDISHRLPASLLKRVSNAVVGCDLPRALSRTSRLNLRALSGPAIEKRPSIVNWIGENLAPIACGVLQQMLEDRALQRAIQRREVLAVVTTTRGVLRTAESEFTSAFRTTINYFFHDDVLYSDAIALPVSADERLGFTPLHADEIGSDLFGDGEVLARALARSP